MKYFPKYYLLGWFFISFISSTLLMFVLGDILNKFGINNNYIKIILCYLIFLCLNMLVIYFIKRNIKYVFLGKTRIDIIFYAKKKNVIIDIINIYDISYDMLDMKSEMETYYIIKLKTSEIIELPPRHVPLAAFQKYCNDNQIQFHPLIR